MAPAPSPKRMHVLRSSQSINLEKVSEPTTKARFICPLAINEFAVVRAYTKPARTACTSKAKPCCIPKPFCTMVATDGKVRSGVEVATKMASTSSILQFALVKASFAASMAIFEVVSFSDEKCRLSIPVLLRIHASLVSRLFSNSKFSTTRRGR